jgi:CRP/FNR family transcriptional regulator, dissimilatory nitrate respiration regulator
MEKILEFCPLFRGLTIVQIEESLSKVHYQVKQYSKGQIIAMSGDECRSLQILLEGSVKGEMDDFSGKVIKIEDIDAPRPLAVAFLFGMDNRFPVNIVANNDIKLLVISKESVIQLLQINKVILQNYLNVMSNRAQFLSEKLRFLSFRSLKGKLAHYLLHLSKGQAIEVVLPNSQEELAGMFGVARPSLGRAIRDLHNLGIIRASARYVQILKKDQLVALLEQ